MMNLTPNDVKALATEKSPALRGLLASKIAADYRGGHFSTAEAEIANDIFRILLKDVEKKVRAALAEELSHCAQAPHDIIFKLASDEIDVASSVLEYSTVLNDADLMTIVESTHEVARLRAIARREKISEPVSGCLIEKGEETVLKELFRNKGAHLGEEQLMHAWNHIAASPSLLETLVHRGGLPLTVAEKIYFAVSEELRRDLAVRYKFNTPAMHKALSDIREWQMLGIIPADGIDPRNDEDVEDLVDDLYRNGRLSYSLMIRSLCVGNLQLFETGIARLAGVPRVNARMLLMDRGTFGFDALYDTAALPAGFKEAVRTLLRLSFEETKFGRVPCADFRKRIIERIYIDKYHHTVENMDYMLSLIGGKIAATDNVH